MISVRKALSLVLSALTLVVALAGCGMFSPDMVEDTVIIDLPKQLSVDVVAQDVRVHVGDECSVHYRVPSGQEPQITQDGGVLTILGSEKGGDTSGFSVKTYVDITLTKRDLETASIRTTSGDIVVEDVDVSGEIKTNSGDISIHDSQCKKDIDISATSGDLNIDACSFGAITKKSTSGDTRIDDTEAKSIDLQTTSGETAVSCNNRCDMKVQCTSGDISLKLAGAPNSYNYDLSVNSGDIVVDGESHGDEYVEDQQGDYNIYCRTTSGDITLRFNG